MSQTEQSEGRAFFQNPVLNSPYEYPCRHWDLDENNQPTNKIVESRRVASFVTPIARARRVNQENESQGLLDLINTEIEQGDDGQDYDYYSHINSIRDEVNAWRSLPQSQWRVTPDTLRLLTYWAPSVNQLGVYGTWRFAQFESVFNISRDFDHLIESVMEDSHATVCS